jgi:2-keto-4-pentenoate hydratase/2-oxohepta-3-ene-1,7-dioic acid hydratase in catechol pathway
MRLARLGPVSREVPTIVLDGTPLDLRPVTDDIGPAFLGSRGLERAADAVAADSLQPLDGAADLRVGAPISRPGKIVCIGLNYRDHAAETGAAIPTEPVVFLKDPSTVVGPFDTVLSCETFNPLGPEFVTADEVGDPQDLRLSLSVNGVKRQDGRTADMVFPVDHLVWYVSQYMVLEPGDLINTGTPAGVAMGLPDQPYLRAGDVVELGITGLGSARQPFKQA